MCLRGEGLQLGFRTDPLYNNAMRKVYFHSFSTLRFIFN